MVVSTFYGVGVGPGDEKLLTLRGVEAIQKAKVIFTPMKRDGTPGIAYDIASEYINLDTPIVPLAFPMIGISENADELERVWEENAVRIAMALKNGDVAFLTLGDPFLYSTYAYILEYLKKVAPHYNIETIPGVNAFSALASRLAVPLALGEESLAICSMTLPEEEIRKIFSAHDNIIVMKASGKSDLLKELLVEHDLTEHFVLLSNIGFANERISRDLADLDALPYLSTLLVKKNYTFDDAV